MDKKTLSKRLKDFNVKKLDKISSTCPFCSTEYTSWERREAGCNICWGNDQTVKEIRVLIDRALKGEDVEFLRSLRVMQDQHLLDKINIRIKELETI